MASSSYPTKVDPMSVDIISNTATMYAEDIVAFVLLQHGISWQLPNSATANRVVEHLQTRFHRQVGKVIVALAKDTEKAHLLETGRVFQQLVTTNDQFERFSRFFATIYFAEYGCTQISLFKLFAYIVEFSILCHVGNRWMENAPEVAAKVIANILVKTNHGTFIEEGGLSTLNQAARYVLSDPNSDASKSYKNGTFAW